MRFANDSRVMTKYMSSCLRFPSSTSSNPCLENARCQKQQWRHVSVNMETRHLPKETTRLESNDIDHALKPSAAVRSAACVAGGDIASIRPPSHVQASPPHALPPSHVQSLGKRESARESEYVCQRRVGCYPPFTNHLCQAVHGRTPTGRRVDQYFTLLLGRYIICATECAGCTGCIHEWVV